MAANALRTKQECKGCGACCAHFACPHFGLEEMAALSHEIQNVVEWFKENDFARSDHAIPCYFFNMASRKCLIHGHKPRVCREFEPGGPTCQRLRMLYLPILARFTSDRERRR
jgi:Fe-S-cluster containining protein